MIAPGAQELMDAQKTSNIPTVAGKSFVDVETVLRHFQSCPPSEISQTWLQKDSRAKRISIRPKANCMIRCYQKDTIQRILQSDRIPPTLVVMPCGSGKTMTALALMCCIRRKTLIITNYKIVANQWKSHVLQYFDTNEKEIACIADDDFAQRLTTANMIIVTYDTLRSIVASESRRIVSHLLTEEFPLIVLDEAHKAVASSYFCTVARLRGTIMAFTATPVREDREMQLLYKLTADTIEVEAQSLVEMGYISRIMCSTIRVPFEANQFPNLLKTRRQKRIAAVLNPYKMCLLLKLLRDFQSQMQKVLIFCDDIFSLKQVAKDVKAQYAGVIGPIWMDTSETQREQFVTQFLNTTNAILLISRTGDEGLDVPSANKLIQICTPWGSRRQHAQRVGRVQRATTGCDFVCEAITIVSDHTDEIHFAEKRDEYLQQCGYIVHKDIADMAWQNMDPLNDRLRQLLKSTTHNKHHKRQTSSHVKKSPRLTLQKKSRRFMKK